MRERVINEIDLTRESTNWTIHPYGIHLLSSRRTSEDGMIESHTVIDIDKKSFPDDIDLTINSVVVKIDTTSLYNVKTTNTVVARNDSGPKNIVVEAGYYDQESLEEMFGSYLTFTEDGYAHPSGPAYDLVFQQAADLSRILGFDGIQMNGKV